MRAIEPDETGVHPRDHWERFGDGDTTVLFVPPWAIVHSRVWKMQVRLLRAPLPRRRLRPARQRALRAPGRIRPPTPRPSTRADLLAVMDASAPSGPWS